MTTFATQVAADLSLILTEDPVSLTVGSETHTGMRDNLSLTNRLDPEVLRRQYRFSVHIRRDDWTTVPDVDSVATIAGTAYRIVGVADDPVDAARRLDLGEQFARL